MVRGMLKIKYSGSDLKHDFGFAVTPASLGKPASLQDHATGERQSQALGACCSGKQPTELEQQHAPGCEVPRSYQLAPNVSRGNCRCPWLCSMKHERRGVGGRAGLARHRCLVLGLQSDHQTMLSPSAIKNVSPQQ
jgi:hypothetical protein